MKKFVSTILLAVVMGSLAIAQGGQGRGQGRGGFGGGPYSRAGAQYMLLAHPDIQTALKLTDDQKSKLEAADAARRTAMQGARDATDPAAARTKATTDYASAIDTALNSDQKTQLLDIFVLLAKNQALENPDVQSALSLGSDETAKIKALVTKEGEANRALGQKVADGAMTRQDAAAARAKNGETLGTELLGALTDDHKAAFAKMSDGANFTPAAGTNYFRFGRGGGGRRGGGARSGGN